MNKYKKDNKDKKDKKDKKGKKLPPLVWGSESHIKW